MYYGNSQFAMWALGTMYVVCAGVTAHAILGIARTAATQLPVHPDSMGPYPPLFLGDYTITLRAYDGMSRKILKIVILAVCGLLTAGGVAFLFYGHIRLGFTLTGGQQHRWWVVGLHVLAWLVLAGYAIYRGVSRANRKRR